MENYHITIKLNASAGQVFNALTDKIPLWWTEMFEGSSNQKGNSFTVRFGESIYKTMQVEKLVPNAKVVWYVKDSLIAIPGLKNQTEWIGTSISWEIKSKDNNTQLELTHLGLNPETECYDICTNGWQQFTDSLKLYVETGEGKSFKEEKKQINV
ncbi:SRPBCC family protein [Pedobacter immunditicola]|uniref:SRPBCC family protein n=1 Tax=Pedobacter immunditicola TaxID=3133440 RepID=UPI00309A07A8